MPLSDFCPGRTIELWWKDKVHRPNWSERLAYTGSTLFGSASESVVETEQPLAATGTMLLEEWDELMGGGSDDDD